MSVRNFKRRITDIREGRITSTEYRNADYPGEGLSIQRSLRHGLLVLGHVTSHRFLNDILFNFLRDDSRELVC